MQGNMHRPGCESATCRTDLQSVLCEPGLRFCYRKHSRGSVMTPVTALAATVSGLARNTRASLCPMRPGKLRLVVLIQLIGAVSPPNVSLGPPRQAAHDGGPILAPAARKTSSRLWP